jgi:hypothetical protein
MRLELGLDCGDEGLGCPGRDQAILVGEFDPATDVARVFESKTDGHFGGFGVVLVLIYYKMMVLI